MKKKSALTISSPDELNKGLQHTSPITWVILIGILALLLAFLAWGMFTRIPAKLSGSATITDGVATLRYKASDAKDIKAGQKVTINGKEAEILTVFKDTNTAQTTSFELENGNYTYYVVVKEIRPLDFLLGK